MPRITSNFITCFAWGLQKMIAGFVLLSAAVGMIFIGASVALSVPLWIALAACPVVCSLTLLLISGLWSMRSTAPAPVEALPHTYSHG